jgi:hypothetical protein
MEEEDMKKILLTVLLTLVLGGMAMASTAMIIKTETAKDGLQYIGDIVAVFPDSHIFSSTELAVFDFLTISGTVEDVKALFNEILPRIETAYLWPDGDYYWDDTDSIDSIDVFRLEGSNKWYRLDNDFKFPLNAGDLTPEEKQILETTDINHPSVTNFIRKIVKDLVVLSGNDVEIKELRNTEPV